MSTIFIDFVFLKKLYTNRSAETIQYKVRYRMQIGIPECRNPTNNPPKIFTGANIRAIFYIPTILVDFFLNKIFNRGS